MHKIQAVLKDADVTLRGISCGLAYREYLDLQAQAVIKAHSMILSAIKEIETHGRLVFQLDSLQMLSEKQFPHIDEKVVLSAILEAAITSVIAANGNVCINGDLGAQSEKYLANIATGVHASGSLAEVELDKLLSELSLKIAPDCDIERIHAGKSFDVDGALSLISGLSGRLDSHAGDLGSKALIKGSLNIVAAKFRNMYEIYDLTMGGIYDLAMEQLYMNEEE